jgi:urea transport system permease protein
MGFGGNNGLTDFKDILGYDIRSDATRSTLFAITAVALALAVLITSAIVRSKYGKVLIAVRDAESRTRFLGYRVEHVKLFAFVVSACMAGVAGALYVPQIGIINPSEFAPANSIEVVIWTAVGGRATLAGPIIGAILVNAGKSYFTGVLSDSWLFVLGGLFIAVTLFLPQGIVGTIAKGWQGHAARRRSASAEKGASPPAEPPPRLTLGAPHPSAAQMQAAPAE